MITYSTETDAISRVSTFNCDISFLTQPPLALFILAFSTWLLGQGLVEEGVELGADEQLVEGAVVAGGIDTVAQEDENHVVVGVNPIDCACETRVAKCGGSGLGTRR